MKDSEAEELDVLPLSISSILSGYPAAAALSPHVSVCTSTCQQHMFVHQPSLFLVDLSALFWPVQSADISEVPNIFCPVWNMFYSTFLSSRSSSRVYWEHSGKTRTELLDMQDLRTELQLKIHDPAAGLFSPVETWLLIHKVTVWLGCEHQLPHLPSNYLQFVCSALHTSSTYPFFWEQPTVKEKVFH